MTPAVPVDAGNAPTPARSITRPWIYRPVRRLARLWAFACFRLEITGRHHLPPTGPFLVLVKHQRWQDVPLVGLAISVDRPAGFVAKTELFRHPMGRFFFSSLGGFALDRQRPMTSRGELSRLREALGAGHGIVIFPEGTYYPDRMGPARVGALRYVLRRQSMPIYPAGIIYHPKRGWRRRVSIQFGGGVFADATAPALEVINDVMKSIAVLSGMESPQ